MTRLPRPVLEQRLSITTLPRKMVEVEKIV